MDFSEARSKLVALLAANIHDKRTLSAMAKVPREFFVPPEMTEFAYANEPLPIGYSQTISQPYIVALMTENLELKGNEKVLEIGTGSGYQTAILAELAKHVVSVERIPELAENAKQVLARLKYKNIEIHLAGETLGWINGAPYDAIITTAASPKIPEELLHQLAIGGRMVIPVGARDSQDLLKITRTVTGNKIINLVPVRFVALIGKGAWDDYGNLPDINH